MVQQADIQVRASPHFHVQFLSGSFAEQNTDSIVERLENSWSVITTLLEIAPGDPVTVTLVNDLVVDGGPRQGTGVVRPRLRQLREIYRPDVPGPGLEHSLALVALSTVTDHPPVPFLLDGFVSCVTRRLPGVSQEDPRRVLQQAARSGTLPPLVGLFAGSRPATERIYPGAALSFVDFLLRKFGPTRFKQFVDLLRPGHGPEAALTAYGRPMKALEKGWRKSLGASPGGGIMRFLRLIGPYLWPYRLKMAEILLYVLVSVAFSIGVARVQGFLLDKALIPGNVHVLIVTMVVVATAFIITILTQVRLMYLVAFVSESVLRELRLRMFTLVQHLHPGFFHRMPTGDILTRMTADLDQVQGGLPAILAQGIRMNLTVVVAVITVFTLNWKLALLSLVAVPLLFITGRVFGPRAAAASVTRQQKLATSITTLEEDLTAQPVVKAFGLENWALRRYSSDLVDVFRSAVRMSFIAGTSGATFASIGSLIQLTVMGLGGYLVVERQLSPGTLFAFLALMAQVIGPMQNLSSVIQSVQQASGGMERVHELLQEKPAIADAPDAKEAARLSGEIRVDNVSFSYAGAEPNLRNVSITVAAGTTLALVGPSGGGKSTLLNMIMRFYDPAAGSVLFDGMDVRTCTLESIRGQIGLVLQDNVLFNISIRENIRLGNLSATDDDIEAAARIAEIHESIADMPQGYDTLVGEGGGELSGGQRQRVAIARAMVRNPSILLLDEATSALDSRTEAAINQTLQRIGAGRTTIDVTHRLEAAAVADRIAVVDHGEIVEEGTHIELLDRGGLYAVLWHEQMGTLADGMPPGVARLRDIPVFAQLPVRLLVSLADQLYIERYRAGDTIVEQGDVGDDLYIIRKGQVDVSVRDPVGGTRHLAVLQEGANFGETALLHDAPRMATITARTPVQVYALTGHDFNALLAADPELRETLERIIAERNRAAAESAVSEVQPQPM